MKVLSAVFAIVLLPGAWLWAQQGQQAPPLTNQSSYPADTHRMSNTEKSHTAAGQGEIVDLNTASKKDIAALPGVGPDYAQSNIDARPFNSKEQLLAKKIIPQATYDKIKDRISAGGPKEQSLPQSQRHWSRA